MKAMVDLAGATLWVDCEPGRYASTSYTRVSCESKPYRLSRSGANAATYSGTPVKRPLIGGDLKVIEYQSQEADNTFITSDGTSSYNSTRKWQ